MPIWQALIPIKPAALGFTLEGKKTYLKKFVLLLKSILVIAHSLPKSLSNRDHLMVQ
jgi:hypothetical protein